MIFGPRRRRFLIAGPVVAVLAAACTESSTIVGVGGVPVDLTITVEQDVGAGMPTAGVDTLELEVGETATLAALATNAMGLPVGAGPVSWSSSDEAVVTVASDGVVTAVGEGSAEVIASVDEVSATLPVAVSVPGSS
jgi:hypothetical protein